MKSTIEQRLTKLISQMTLEEKISQMSFDAPPIERLGIPAYNWWNEALHGVGRAGLATVFPQAIGLAATWNPDLLEKIATAISDEARAKHHEAGRRGLRNMYVGLTFWSPNVNIFRDPRWGRGMETYGEDPYLTSAMAVAFIKGLQGDHPDYLKLVATPKHFAVHSGPEVSRHHFDARVDEKDLRATYLPAFEACIREAHAVSIMGAYNRLNGEPCCASHKLLDSILRQEWGFDGYVVSDCGAIRDIYAHHKVVDSPSEAASLAVQNGCELNCGEVYPALIEAVEGGLISEASITQAVERLFKARSRLGMFDAPEVVPYSKIPYDVVDSPAHRELALEAARQSIVLLKNEGGLLPLSKDIESIAVFGPNANEIMPLLGNYNGTPRDVVTPLEGIRRKISPQTMIYSAQGSEIAPSVLPMHPIPQEYLHPHQQTIKPYGLMGSYYANANFQGEPTFERIDSCIDFTWKDTSPISGIWGDRFSVRWSGYLIPKESGRYRLGVYGLNQYRLYLEDDRIVENSDIHHPVLKSKDVELVAGKPYSIRIDYINCGLDPQVRLLWSVPECDYHTNALEIAQKGEVIVMALGLSPTLEGEEMPVNIEGFYGGDRTDIRLPQPQLRLLQEVHALGKPIVLVLLNGSALGIPWAAENIPAIVEAWYPGQAGGLALADVLFGDYNPSGRLPLTFYRSIDDLPPFDDYNMEGRTYRYFHGEPLYAFGHGLSYTSFTYRNIERSKTQICGGEKITIRCEVTNVGACSGDEVVQIYLRQNAISEQPAIKELKGFVRLHLIPGECRQVAFTLGAAQLRSYQGELGWQVLPGRVEVMIGGSSVDLPVSTSFEVVGAPVPAQYPEKYLSQIEIK